MAKQTKGGMHGGKNRKLKGRSAISKILEPAPSHPPVAQAMRAEVDRTVTAAGNMNKHRGDRRDMSRTYTGNVKHASRAGNPRRDVSTRAR